MNLQQFLLALRARFGVFAAVLATTVLAAAVASLLLPKSYTATVSLLVDTRDEQSLSNSLRPLVLPQERLSYLQTQIDIIGSKRVARRAVQELKLAEDASTRALFEKSAPEQGSIEDWLAERLLRNLDVKTSQSNVIQLSFSSADPRYSALIANAFAKAYADTLLELRVVPTRDAASWFDEQLKGLRANLEKAQAKLTDYQRKTGIVSTDDRVDVESARLSELTSQLVKAQGQTFDLKTREQQARSLLEHGVSPERLPDVLSNDLIQKLSSDLAHGEAKLEELASQYGPNYPLYQRQLSENRGLRKKLDAETGKIVAGIAVARRQSSQREADLSAAIAAQRERMLKFNEDRNGLAVLTRNVESAQRTYENALQRSFVSQVESHANQANVSILSPARAPARPSRPNLPLNIALSVVVGTTLALGIVILMEMTDRRVRSRNELDVVPSVPLLGVLNAWQPALLGRPGGAARALPRPG